MSILCGWASQSEHGSVTGTAGDQTGREVKTGSWYDFGQTAVYRWKNRSYANTYASIIKYWCNCDYVGYDQSQRTTLGEWCKKHGWSYKVNTPVETDCSRMVADGINCTLGKEVFSIGSTFYTGNLGDRLMATGLFTKLTGPKYCDGDSYLMVGDIINNPARHVITALANGSNAQPVAKTLSQVAQEVIDGKWGTGDERKRRLRAAGYDPDQVQKLVNSMLTKNGWKKENGVWHCYRNNVMLKNCWAKDSHGWCWLNSKGEITKSKWIQDKGTWYYLNSDGYMATNKWQRDSKGWCYVGSDGKMYKSRWLKWKGAWYWLKSDGRMATTPQTICGKVYKFGKDGKWVK